MENRKIKNDRLAVLDIETTGLNKYLDKIIEICINEIHLNADGSSVIKNEFYFRFNPIINIQPSAFMVHGINNQDLKDCPIFVQESENIFNKINDVVVVAHNAIFDLAFIQNEMRLCGYKINMSFIDTLSFFRKTLSLERYRLQDVAKHFNLSCESSDLHSAKYDTLLLSKIVMIVLENCAMRPVFFDSIKTI